MGGLALVAWWLGCVSLVFSGCLGFGYEYFGVIVAVGLGGSGRFG